MNIPLELFYTHLATLMQGNGMFREENVPNFYTRHHYSRDRLCPYFREENVPKLSVVGTCTLLM